LLLLSETIDQIMYHNKLQQTYNRHVHIFVSEHGKTDTTIKLVNVQIFEA